MRLILDPYQLAARGPACMAAFILADEPGGVGCLLPTPLPRNGEHAPSPALTRLAEAWRWSGPVWRRGIAVSPWNGTELAAALRRAIRELGASDPGAALTGILQEDRFEDDSELMDLIAADIARGGVNPAVTLTVRAALRALAAEQGCPFFTADAPGAPRRARAACDAAQRAARVPVLITGSGEALLRAREVFAEEIAALAVRLGGLFSGGPCEPDSAADAAEALANAMRQRLSLLDRTLGKERDRARPAWVTLTASTVPASEPGRHATLLRSAAGPATDLPPPALAVHRPDAIVVTARLAPWDFSPSENGRPTHARSGGPPSPRR